jgi:hypothetical protein
MDHDKRTFSQHDNTGVTPVEQPHRSAWKDPTITRIEIKRTMFGAHSGTDSTVFTTPTH